MHPTLQQTRSFIRRVHAGQLDKGGQPYHLHPEAVENRLKNESEYIRHIALLHDTIEDTNVSDDMLRSLGYDEHIVQTVMLLSRPKGGNRPSYIDWIKSIATSGNRSAILVKIADNQENSSPERIANLPPENRDIVKRYARSLEILHKAMQGNYDF